MVWSRSFAIRTPEPLFADEESIPRLSGLSDRLRGLVAQVHLSYLPVGAIGLANGRTCFRPISDTRGLAYDTSVIACRKRLT